MPEDRRDVIITKETSGNSLAIIIGAVIIAVALIYGFWYFATQDQAGESGPNVTVEIDPGGDPYGG